MSDVRKDIMASYEPGTGTADGQPAWLQDRLNWFENLKFGLFMHWGPYCQWGCIESWPLVEADTWARPDGLPAWTERGKDLARFRQDYWKLNETFNPQGFEPERWAELAERAGMKYVAFTTKHHDGFCMFDTRTTNYRSTYTDCPFHTNPRANITREVFDAFRARDFGISCYFSKSDWHCPHYWCRDFPYPDRNVNYDIAERPRIWEEFIALVHGQVEELMTGYGHIDALWLDGGQVRPPKQDIRMADMAATARRHQPGLIMVDRTVGGAYENILTPEQKIPAEPLGQTWESCLTMGNGWAYRPGDQYKPTRELIHMLVDIVAKGGNFLLNIGPDPDGRFAPDAILRMNEIADWMAVNARAIHGTRAVAPYKEGNICFTRRDKVVNAIVLAEEGMDEPPATIALSALRPAPGSDVRMLGCERPLEWSMTGDAAVVTMPSESRPCEHAWVLEFTPLKMPR